MFSLSHHLNPSCPVMLLVVKRESVESSGHCTPMSRWPDNGHKGGDSATQGVHGGPWFPALVLSHMCDLRRVAPPVHVLVLAPVM